MRHGGAGFDGWQGGDAITLQKQLSRYRILILLMLSRYKKNIKKPLDKRGGSVDTMPIIKRRLAGIAVPTKRLDSSRWNTRRAQVMSSVYEIVTERIIKKMESGVVPWRKPWGVPDLPNNGLPMNLISGKPYRGINCILLWMSGWDCPYYVTMKQAKDLGGGVRKGSKAEMVTFFKEWEVEASEADRARGVRVDDEGNKRVPVLRYYNVFNVDACEGIEHERVREYKLALAAVGNDWEPGEDYAVAEALAAGVTWVPVRTGSAGQGAYYEPIADRVTVPERRLFNSPAAYYETLFHELVHASGAAGRLGRKLTGARGDREGYSREELIAEIGAAMLMAHCGIMHHVLDNTAAYLHGWMKYLKDDAMAIVIAAGAAQKAVDWILAGGVVAAAGGVESDAGARAARVSRARGPVAALEADGSGQLDLFAGVA